MEANPWAMKRSFEEIITPCRCLGVLDELVSLPTHCDGGAEVLGGLLCSRGVSGRGVFQEMSPPVPYSVLPVVLLLVYLVWGQHARW